MLSAQELKETRKQAEAALVDLCTIQTYTEENTKGSVVKVWADTYQFVKCRVAAKDSGRGREYVTAQGVKAVAQFVGTFVFNQAGIDPKNRVVHDGNTYKIVAIEAGQSYRTARRAYMALDG